MPSFGHICILQCIHGMRKEAAEGPLPALASAPHCWCRRPCPTVGVVGTRSKPHRRCCRPHVLVVLTPLLSAAISTHHPPCSQLLAAAEAGAVLSWGRCTCRRPHLILVVLVDRFVLPSAWNCRPSRSSCSRSHHCRQYTYLKPMKNGVSTRKSTHTQEKTYLILI
jgi:hypothetical protein